MLPLPCIIVDDEPIAREILQEYIQRDDRLVLTGSYATASDTLREINIKKPRLVFLDIKMPQISGFEMLRSMPQHPFIIFTTAFREYAVEGFDLNAIDYLLKPFPFERFLQAVNKVFVLYTAENAEPTFAKATAGKPAADSPAEASAKADESGKHIFVKSEGKLIRINMEDIYYIEALKEYVRIFTPDGPLVIYQTMQHLEEKLPSELFFRIHRSYIIGTRHIKAIEGNTVLVHKTQLPVSRYIKEQFMQHVAGNNLL